MSTGAGWRKLTAILFAGEFTSAATSVGEWRCKEEITFARHASARHHSPMNTVAEIKQALANLTMEERAELLSELCGWSEDEWDRQMKADAARFCASHENLPGLRH